MLLQRFVWMQTVAGTGIAGHPHFMICRNCSLDPPEEGSVASSLLCTMKTAEYHML